MASTPLSIERYREIQDQSLVLPAYADHLDKINGLLRASFGWRFRGNLREKYACMGEWDLLECEDLCAIVRPNFILSQYYYKRAGRVGNPGERSDGSKIIVYPAYIPQAEKYAELYKEMFEKKADIQVADSIHPDTRFEFIPFRS